MPVPLVERLNAARRRYFVGRNPECSLFEKAITSFELPFSLLYLFGAGGVGKTTLLWEFEQICQTHGYPAVYLDARNIDAVPAAFLDGLTAAMRLNPTEDPVAILAQQPHRYAILIDSYELLNPIEDWLREEFLPRLPEQLLVIIASRRQPASGWRTDPGWRSLLRSVPLRNLNWEDCCIYLTRREISAAHHQAIFNFTYGHPLALSLVADEFTREPDRAVEWEATPDVVKTLIERCLEEVPSSEHRMALEACAVVRLVTEALLAEMLGVSDAHELFEWLRELCFVEVTPLGLWLHDLVRDVLVADLRWRHPSWFAQLNQRACACYSTRLEQAQGNEQLQILSDTLFLHRHHPAVRSRFVWRVVCDWTTDIYRESDRSAILQIAAARNSSSARLVDYWLRRQPHHTLVIRDGKRQVMGFVVGIALHEVNEDDRAIDPAVFAASHCLQSCTPLRLAEGAMMYRFWMGKDPDQPVSLAQNLIFLNMVQHHRRTPGVAYTFVSCENPEFWADLFAYTGFARLPEADFKTTGQTWGMYGHDWRVMPPALWWERLAQQLISGHEVTSVASSVEAPLVLSQPEFEKAVQDALRHFARPEVLANNPLLRSRMVVEQAATDDREQRIGVLQTWVRDAAESLQASPRDEKLYRALYRTYLQPAPTQEQAAESLDLPFSTYRRHLKTGVGRVAEILWQRETRFCS